MIFEMYKRHEELVLGVVSLVSIGVLWQLVVDLGLVNEFFISKPSDVFREMAVELEDGSMVENILATLHSFVLSLALAAVVGIGLGAMAGWFPDFEAALEPFIWFKYSAPTIAFYPLFVAWLGYGTPTIVAIAFLFALTPIYANTLAGIKNVDRDLVRSAHSFGATPLDIFFRIALPGSVPIVVAGLRLGVGRALTGVVVAELFGASAGLGFSIAYYSQFLKTTKMMVSILIIILLGVVLTQILTRLEKTTDTWRVRDN